MTVTGHHGEQPRCGRLLPTRRNQGKPTAAGRSRGGGHRPTAAGAGQESLRPDPTSARGRSCVHLRSRGNSPSQDLSQSLPRGSDRRDGTLRRLLPRPARGPAGAVRTERRCCGATGPLPSPQGERALCPLTQLTGVPQGHDMIFTLYLLFRYGLWPLLEPETHRAGTPPRSAAPAQRA